MPGILNYCSKQATPGDTVNPRGDAGRDTGGQQQAQPRPCLSQPVGRSAANPHPPRTLGSRRQGWASAGPGWGGGAAAGFPQADRWGRGGQLEQAQGPAEQGHPPILCSKLQGAGHRLIDRLSL